MNLDQLIEGVLFYKTEPMKKVALAEFFSADPEEIDAALTTLTARLSTGATRIVTTDSTVQLMTAPELADTIERLKKDELKGDIGKAGAETLAIILYRGPISRIEVDRIRGVNSTFILRNLLVRGLIERRDHPSDPRSFTYTITPALLGNLGIARREDLPEFADILNALDVFEKEQNHAQGEVS